MKVTAIQNKEPFDVYIGRQFGGFSASIWGNPYKIGRDGSGEEVLAKYEAHIRRTPDGAIANTEGEDVGLLV